MPVWKEGWFVGYKILLNSPIKIAKKLFNYKKKGVVFKYFGNNLRMLIQRCWLRHFKEDNPMWQDELNIRCEMKEDGVMLYVPKERQVRDLDDFFGVDN